MANADAPETKPVPIADEVLSNVVDFFNQNLRSPVGVVTAENLSQAFAALVVTLGQLEQERVELRAVLARELSKR